MIVLGLVMQKLNFVKQDLSILVSLVLITGNYPLFFTVCFAICRIRKVNN